MTAQINVVSPEMLTAASHVIEAKGDVQATSTSLNSEVHGHQAGWVGQGGTAFRSLMDAWNERLRVVTNALDTFEQALRGTEAALADADDAEAAVHAGVTNTFEPRRLSA